MHLQGQDWLQLIMVLLNAFAGFYHGSKAAANKASQVK